MTKRNRHGQVEILTTRKDRFDMSKGDKDRDGGGDSDGVGYCKPPKRTQLKKAAREIRRAALKGQNPQKHFYWQH